MNTDKLQQLKELLLKAHDIASTLSDEEGDVMSDAEAAVNRGKIIRTHDADELFGFLAYDREVVEKFFDDVEGHLGFPEHYLEVDEK